MLIQLLVLAAFSLQLSVATRCARCGTPGLESIWALTGYPSPPPAGFEFVAACTVGKGDGVGEDAACTGACVEMAIPTGTNSWEFLRGCHPTLADRMNQYLTNTPAKPTCQQMEVPERGTNVMRFCVNDTCAVLGTETVCVVCNTAVAPDGGGLNYGPVKWADPTNPCTQATTLSCLKCASFDGKGKCSSGDKADTNAKGTWCTKAAGKYSGHDYVERGPTMLMPTERTDSFCIESVVANTTSFFGPMYGSTVTRSKRSVTQLYSGQTCYCNTDGCNSAPTVLGAFATLMLLLSALPFFC